MKISFKFLARMRLCVALTQRGSLKTRVDMEWRCYRMMYEQFVTP